MESPLEKAIVRDLIVQGHSNETILQTCKTPELGLDIDEVSKLLKKEESGVSTYGFETTLSVRDFQKYFEDKKLGKLYLPNGISFDKQDYRWERPFKDGIPINLKDLYKVMSGWKIKNTQVPLEDIIAIIAFGSAVRYPGYDIVTESSRKYFGLFGPKIEKEKKKKIYPNDADFFVLTGSNITRHEYIKPGFTTVDFGSLGCVTAVVEGGINLVNRGADQLLNGLNNGDTISISALKEGIPLFFDGDKLNEVYERSGIKKETPRRLFWDEDKLDCLVGRIE